MSLCIKKPGIFTTVQDLGRSGYQYAGIAPGGAMDTLAASLANCIAGNSTTEAVIEMSFPAPVIVFNQPAVIAIAGADFCPLLNGSSLKNCKPIFVQPGDVLSFDKKIWGAWAYLAIHGGIALQQWLGSYSTHTIAGAGGVKGRALQKDDVIEYKKVVAQPPANFNWQLPQKEWQQWYSAGNTIDVMPGNELGLLDDSSKKFFTENFTVTPQSGRMGYQLKGPSLQLLQHIELISSAVVKGTVQLLPSGACIVLMAGCQTTGGYPRMAHVTAACMPAMAQAQYALQLQFRLTDVETAENNLLQMHQWQQQVRLSCEAKYTGF